MNAFSCNTDECKLQIELACFQILSVLTFCDVFRCHFVQQVAGYTDLTHLTVQGKLCVKVIVYVNKTNYLSCKILPQL